MSSKQYEIVVHASIEELGEAEYRAVTGDATPPFLQFEWLDALERSGCISPETGWLPHHFAVHRTDASGKRLVAVAPAYVKWHSDGEFVFDHGWANFAEQRLNIDYYPKLILAVPITPATGPRVLVLPGEEPARVQAVLSQAIQRLLNEVPLSSAHVLFPPEEETERWESVGWARRFGVQFHWSNPGYRTYDEFLSRFNSKRRAALRRERRALSEQGVAIRIYTGSDISERVIEAMYAFYLSTVDKFVWGRRYLNREFFFQVASTMSDRLHIVLAEDATSGRVLGGAFNLLGHDTLYGRYWGCVEERPFLHFNVCYYAGIEDCIARGLKCFEPGAGGEHKLARGFEPTLTHSAHYIIDPRLDGAVRDFLGRERAAVMNSLQEARQHPVLQS